MVKLKQVVKRARNPRKKAVKVEVKEEVVVCANCNKKFFNDDQVLCEQCRQV